MLTKITDLIIDDIEFDAIDIFNSKKPKIVATYLSSNNYYIKDGNEIKKYNDKFNFKKIAEVEIHNLLNKTNLKISQRVFISKKFKIILNEIAMNAYDSYLDAIKINQNKNYFMKIKCEYYKEREYIVITFLDNCAGTNAKGTAYKKASKYYYFGKEGKGLNVITKTLQQIQIKYGFGVNSFLNITENGAVTEVIIDLKLR